MTPKETTRQQVERHLRRLLSATSPALVGVGLATCTTACDPPPVPCHVSQADATQRVHVTASWAAGGTLHLDVTVDPGEVLDVYGVEVLEGSDKTFAYFENGRVELTPSPGATSMRVRLRTQCDVELTYLLDLQGPKVVGNAVPVTAL